MAALIWALRSGSLGTAPISSSKISAPDWFVDYVQNAHEQTLPPLEISGPQITPYVNAWPRENGNSLVRDLLSLESATIGLLELDLYGSIWLSPRSEGPPWARGETFKSFSYQSWALAWNSTDPDQEHGGLIMGAVDGSAETLFPMIVEKLAMRSIYTHWGSTAYIPAARTGLVLALKELTSSSVGTLGLSSHDANRSRFSKPMINFLQTIIRDADGQETPASKIADFLQDSIFSGQIGFKGKGSPTFYYKPSGTDTRLPMHAVSSMITELAPILSLMRGSRFDSIIIEEPEAHLHLSAQRCMARALVRLVNSGIPVVVTTHSDTFLQQINLLIQLSSRKTKPSF